MDDITIVAYVDAWTLEDGDQIAITNDSEGTDYLENITVLHETDAVMVKGYSHVTGDNAVYLLPFDSEVGIWSV